MQKAGRNDPCPCGSGKKYKKCCEMQARPKRFHAEVVSSAAPVQASSGANKVSSLFFRSAIPPVSDKPTPAINVSAEAT